MIIRLCQMGFMREAVGWCWELDAERVGGVRFLFR
jgi:hypothetical protein